MREKETFSILLKDFSFEKKSNKKDFI